MKELIKALYIIQEECKKYDESCTGCPMHDGYGYCRVKDNPCDWKINDEVQKVLL